MPLGGDPYYWQGRVGSGFYSTTVGFSQRSCATKLLVKLFDIV